MTPTGRADSSASRYPRPMATFSARTATPPLPSRTPAGSRASSRRSFDSPANNDGPWPAIRGCTTNSYSSISPSSANASGSFTPPTNSPLPDSRLSCRTALSRSPAHEFRVPVDVLQGARHHVLLRGVDRAGERFSPSRHLRPPPRRQTATQTPSSRSSAPAEEQRVGPPLAGYRRG